MAESQIVVGLFGEAARAREAVELLLHAGVGGANIGLVTGAGDAVAVAGLLEGLGMGAADVGHYADAVPADGALVAVRTDDRADEARAALERAGAERVQASRRVASIADLD